MTLFIVDPWQSCVCFIRSGVIRCTLLMALYLDRMCQSGLHAMLWSHIGTLMHRLAAEPRSTAGLLFPSRCPSGTILLTPYSMVCDLRVSRAGPMLFYWPKLLNPYYSLLLFSLSLLSEYKLVLWAGVFILIGCISLSLNLVLPTFFLIIIIIILLSKLVSENTYEYAHHTEKMSGFTSRLGKKRQIKIYAVRLEWF